MGRAVGVLVDGFVRPGGTDAADYRPTNSGLLRGRAVAIKPMPGSVWSAEDLQVKQDYFGNPVPAAATPGAVEFAPDVSR